MEQRGFAAVAVALVILLTMIPQYPAQADPRAGASLGWSMCKAECACPPRLPPNTYALERCAEAFASCPDCDCHVSGGDHPQCDAWCYAYGIIPWTVGGDHGEKFGGDTYRATQSESTLDAWGTRLSPAFFRVTGDFYFDGDITTELAVVVYSGDQSVFDVGGIAETARSIQDLLDVGMISDDDILFLMNRIGSPERLRL